MAGGGRNLSYVVYQQDHGDVARCLDVNVASEGDTEELAAVNLREALELYFEDTDDDVPPVDQSHVGDLILRTD